MNRIIQTRTFWYAADGDVICGGNVLSSNPLDFDATWKCDKCGKTTKWDQNGLAGIENDLSSRLDDNENDIKVVNFSSLLQFFSIINSESSWYVIIYSLNIFTVQYWGAWENSWNIFRKNSSSAPLSNGGSETLPALCLQSQKSIAELKVSKW